VFSPAVTDHWLAGVAAPAPGRCAVVADDDLPAGRDLQLLRVDGGGAVLRATTARLAALDLAPGRELATAAAVARAGGELGDPDQLFYLPGGALPEGDDGGRTRVLGPADAAAFDRMVAQVPAAEVDEAYVELDHDLVVGTVDGSGELVCAASAYPWRGSALSDIGVLTVPAARERGYAAATVRAISRLLLADGAQPQYRCDVTNTASAGVARAVGFRRYALWQLPPDA
jgi:hypothetical protein